MTLSTRPFRRMCQAASARVDGFSRQSAPERNSCWKDHERVETSATPRANETTALVGYTTKIQTRRRLRADVGAIVSRDVIGGGRSSTRTVEVSRSHRI